MWRAKSLDVCTYCRPYDDQSLLPIRIETDAYYLIVDNVERGRYEVKAITLLEEDTLVRKAVDSLMEKLGPVETQRFLSLPAGKRLDSVRRHQLWQQGLKKDQFFDRAIR